MPYWDGYGRGPEYIDNPETKQRLDAATRAACEALSVIEGYKDGMIRLLIVQLSKDTQRWWSLHQAADKRRKALEEEARHRQEVKTKALAKLSAEERKALGL